MLHTNILRDGAVTRHTPRKISLEVPFGSHLQRTLMVDLCHKKCNDIPYRKEKEKNINK